MAYLCQSVLMAIYRVYCTPTGKLHTLEILIKDLYAKFVL